MAKKNWVVALLVFLPTCVISYQVGRQTMRAEIAQKMSEAFQGFPSTESTSGITTSSKPGQVFNEAEREYELPSMKFKINGFAEKQTLTPQFGSPAKAKEGTKFVVVNLTITNTGTEQFTLFPDSFLRLADAQGRKYQQSSDHWQDVNDYFGGKEMGPGIPEKGAVVYEVPNDASSYHLEEAPQV